MDWYTLNVIAGRERTIAEDVKDKVRELKLNLHLKQVLHVTEETQVQRPGRKGWVTRKHTRMPGYIFLQMNTYPSVINALREVKGVFHLLPSWDNPVAMTAKEVEGLLAQVDPNKTQAKRIVPYDIGQAVKLTHGPFAGVTAVVKDIDEPKPGEPVVKLAIEVLGREAEIEAPFWHCVPA